MKYLKTIFSVLTVLIFIALCYFVLLKADYFGVQDSYFMVISLIIVSLMISYVLANMVNIGVNILVCKLTKQSKVSVTFDNIVKVEGKKYIEKGNSFFAVKFLPNNKVGAVLGLLTGGIVCYLVMILLILIVGFISKNNYLNLVLVSSIFSLFVVFVLNTLPITLNKPNDGKRAFSIIESDEYFCDYIEGIRLTKAFSSLPINEITFKKVSEDNYESVNNQIYQYYQALLLNKEEAKKIMTHLYEISSNLPSSQKALVFSEYLYVLLAIDNDFDKAKKFYTSLTSGFKEVIKEKESYQFKRVYVLYEKEIESKEVIVDKMDRLIEELPLALEEVFHKIK